MSSSVGIQVNFTFFLPTLFVMQCNTTSTSTRFHRAFLLKCFSLAGLYWDWDCVSLLEPTRHPVSQIKPALSFIFGSSSSVRSFSSWNVPGFIDKIFLVISNLKICNLMSASLQPFVSCIVLSMGFNGMEYLLAFALLPSEVSFVTIIELKLDFRVKFIKIVWLLFEGVCLLQC